MNLDEFVSVLKSDRENLLGILRKILVAGISHRKTCAFDYPNRTGKCDCGAWELFDQATDLIKEMEKIYGPK